MIRYIQFFVYPGNGSFGDKCFASDNVVYIFDGLTNDVLTATVEIVTEPVKEIEDILSSQDIFLKRANLQLEGREEADAVFELSEDAIWPGKEGVSNACMHWFFRGLL